MFITGNEIQENSTSLSMSDYDTESVGLLGRKYVRVIQDKV